MSTDADRILAKAKRALAAADLSVAEAYAGGSGEQQVVLDRRVRDGYEKALLSTRPAAGPADGPDRDLAGKVVAALRDRRLRLGPFDEGQPGDVADALARGTGFLEILVEAGR
jgi:hypothetical protein